VHVLCQVPEAGEQVMEVGPGKRERDELYDRLLRATAEFEETKRGPRIVVTEIPYQVNKENLVRSIAELAMAKKIASYPSIGVIQAKRALNHSMEVGMTAGLRFDVEAWVGCMHSDEWKEKLAGFVRKERKS